MTLQNLLTRLEAVASGGEARRIISQGAVKVNDEVVKDVDFKLEQKVPHTIQVSKKIFKVLGIYGEDIYLP